MLRLLAQERALSEELASHDDSALLDRSVVGVSSYSQIR
jgi:hypothetical protein